jgi:hypothetical protein
MIDANVRQGVKKPRPLNTDGAFEIRRIRIFALRRGVNQCDDKTEGQ